MARVMVVSENATISIEVKQDAEGYTAGWCGICQESVTDRWNYEDTVQVIVVHVEQHEARGEDE